MMHARIKAITTAAITTAAMVMMSKAGSAQDKYQFELEAGYMWAEVDSNPDITQTEIPLRASYFFEPVSLKDHPWNEAAFLERSKSASVGLSYYEFEVGGFSADGILYGAGFRYADKDQPFAADIEFQTGSVDTTGLDIDITKLDLSAGYWLADNAIAGLAYSLEDVDGITYTNSTIKAFGKLVEKLDDGKSINLEASLGWASIDTGPTDTNFEITVEGDFYFTPQYSAGAILDLSFGDAASDEGTTFGLRGSAWFTPQVSARIEYSMFSASNSSGNDEDSLGLFVTVRF